jgi:hypothetical protein
LPLQTVGFAAFRRESEGSSYGIGGIRRLDSLAFEQETDGGERLALAFAEGQHELLELRVPLDLEEDLVVVVRDLDVEVLRCGCGRFAAAVVVGRLWGVSHFFCGILWQLEWSAVDAERRGATRRGADDDEDGYQEIVIDLPG